jgi:hypothetical protein
MKPTAMIKTMMACLALPILLAVASGMAAAQNVPSSDLLLPYFEVDAAHAGGLTTLFAVGNSTEKPVDVLATVYTNWGISILEVPFTLQSREVRTVNLRDWFRTGGNPAKALNAAELQHVVAAASGQRSPKDNLYYSSEIKPDLLVGYVTFHTQGNRPDALWGDWFNIDVPDSVARGDVLVNIDRTTGCPGLCPRHLARYLNGGAFDGGTEIVIWRQVTGKPSANPDAGPKMQADATAFDEPGLPLENRQISLLPVEKIAVSALGLEKPFGSLDIETEDDTFIAVQHTAHNRYSIALTTYCLPRKIHPGPGIEILKLTNGEDANATPGPSIPVGDTVTWEYLVTNIGSVDLTAIVVDDDDPALKVSCPKDELAPGESMTCTASGKAKACQYTNTGSVSALSSSGEVDDSDTSHYFGDPGEELSLAVLLNGKDASDAANPVEVPTDTTLNWTFKLTNSGKARLTGIQLTGIGAACPKTALDPGESMSCTATGKAEKGEHSLPVQATGKTSCSETSANGAGHYRTTGGTCTPGSPAIHIENAVNGQDADTAPGLQIPVGGAVAFTYGVSNTGDVALTGVHVTDSKGVTVSCPKTKLQPGESMTCTASGGTAQIGQFSSVGTAAGTADLDSPCDVPVSDDDPVYYYSSESPGLILMKLTNGQDANSAPGPQIAVGSPVLWEYKVTNTGNVTLSNLSVSDDKGVAVTCPKTSLAAGESMTCTGQGVAQACQYANLGTVTGKTPGGQTLTASDSSHYFGTTQPGIHIETAVNGQDADSPTGPQIPVGAALAFTYVVSNTGNVALTGVHVTDSKGVAVSCPKTSLAPGESMTCTGSGTAQSGQYSAVGSVSGQGACGDQVSDDDPVNYYGQATGTQGCSHGYWKNHVSSWAATGYSTSQTVSSVFSQASLYPSIASVSLYDSLSFEGGPTVTDAARNMLKQATGALLNSAHPGVDFPWQTAQLISDVNAALASQNSDTLLSLATQLDHDNTLGCPLN